MNRKITDFAFGVRWPRFAASGLITPSSARSFCWWRIDASASDPKPQNASWMNSRRVRVGRQWFSLGNIEKGIQIEDRKRELLERPALQERGGDALFLRRRRPPRGQAEGERDLVGAALAGQPIGERLG